MEIEICRSSRRTIAIEIRSDSSVLVRAPKSMTDGEIRRFLEKHRDWIEKHQEEAVRRREEVEQAEKLSDAQIRELSEKAKKVIPERVRHYALVLDVTYGRITIRNQKTRWGSCSSKGNLNFNCLLMLMPEEILDYVVVHELAHRREMNHSENFWKIVENVLPDYRKRRKWLKENGGYYLQRADIESGRQNQFLQKEEGKQACSPRKDPGDFCG